VEAFRRRPLPEGDGLRLPGRPVPEASEGRGRRGQGSGVRGPGGHAFRGEAGPGLLAPAGGERPGVGGGPGGAVAAGAQAGAALHHRWASGSTRSHPNGSTLRRSGSGAWCTGCGGAWGRCGPETGPSWRKTSGGCTGAESRGEALEALEALREAWGARYPGVVALWAGDSGAFLRFYGYPKVLWPYLRSTNLMERFIREIRRGTKVRDHKFPSEEAVYKLLVPGVGEARREVGGEEA
jgi:hypothetical protein